MKVSDFDFDLPETAIAQTPAEPRDAARLLVHGISEPRTEHRRVRELDGILSPGDLLVVNDARVRPARIFARRETGGVVELLLLGPALPATGDGAASEGNGPTSRPTNGPLPWRAMVRPARKLEPGRPLEVDGAPLRVVPIARELDREGNPGAIWTLALECEDGEDSVAAVEAHLEACGRMPLPPYIRRDRVGDPRDALDRERYQTVYARVGGAVAAPSAGLHFTRPLFERLDAAGVEVASVSLMVGLGTFLPMTAEDTRDHHMHEERFVLPQATVEAVRKCRERGGRVVAVGTTSVRVLEASAGEDGELRAGEGATDLFIQGDYRFRVVDGLMTNFHLPKSTLVMLVSALAGRERVLSLYGEALERGYRFYSYGDAMLLLP